MPDRLFITSWDIERWGRASGNRKSKIPDGLTVVYGPNASGKSSVAMALAWLLAGPGTMDVLRPFGNFEDPLHASLTAQLGAENVHLDVRMTVPKSTAKRMQSEDFTGDLGGAAIDRDNFRRKLDGVSFDLYRRYYWVDSRKISTTSDTGGGTDHSLTTKSLFGDRDPFDISSKLGDEGRKLLGKSTTKEGTARWFVKEMSVQKELIRTAKQSPNNWAGVDTQHRETIERIETDQAALRESKGLEATLERAIAGRTAHTSWLAAARKLKALIPTEAAHSLADNRVEVERAISDFEAASADVSRSTAELGKNRRDAGGWADLIGTIDVGAGVVAAVGNYEETVRKRRRDRDDANAKRRSAVQPSGVLNTRESTSLPVRLAGYGTALGLAVAAAISVAMEGAIPAIVLGLSAAVVIVVTSRRQSVNHRPVVDFGDDPKYLESRLRDAVKERNKHLSDAGVPDTYISDDSDAHATDLGVVVAGKETKEELDTAVETRDNCLTTLHGYFPSEEETGRYSTLLGGAVEQVDAHKTASDKNDLRLLELQQALGGVETKEQRLLTDHSDSELHEMVEPAREDCSTYEQSIKDMEAERTGLLVELEKVEESLDIQGPTLELDRLESEAQRTAVSGLAYLLAARLIEDGARTYLVDNGPKLLSRALELSSQVATDWASVRLNPQRLGLLVKSENGEHADDSLSTGDLTILNLALRLATIEEGVGTTGTLPIILDDALRHLDQDRELAGISVLKEISMDHQILYFTCREDFANLAKQAEATVINI